MSFMFMGTEMDNNPEKQKYEDLLRHVKLNMAWSKINKLPRHLRPLAERVWRTAKYHRPEDLEPRRGSCRIATILNKEGIPSRSGRPWKAGTIAGIIERLGWHK